MPSYINTNITSLNAQRNLSTSQSSLATSLQRLSSGLRINSAKDDAAGMAIATRFTSQINGTDQAIRNANDGISLAQTAEGALGEITNNLQRIRELALQAANSTNSASDREALDQEVQQRLQEIDRNASQTNFNGQKILDGSFKTANFQIGANAGETISMNLGVSMRTSAIGSVASTTTAGSIGSTGTGGTTTVTASSFNFGTTGSAATAGSVTFGPSTLDFGTTTTAGSTGSATFSAAAFDFRAGSNTTATITNTDFSGGAANKAQMNVTIGSTTVGITLDQDYTNAAGVATAIQSQINAVSGLSNVTVADDGTGKLVFTNNGSPTKVDISSTDTNAQAAGFADQAGVTGSTTPNAQFKIDGKDINLSSNTTDPAGMAADIQTQIRAYGGAYAGYTVTANGSQLKIDNQTNGGAAVVISGANASANQAGIYDATGTAGVAATTANNASFDVGATTVNLNKNYASYSDMASDIGTQLGAGYSVSANGGAITIARSTTGNGSTAVSLSAGTAASDAAGITTGGTKAGIGGQDAVASTNASFQVDGHTVTLNQNYTDANGLRSALASQLSGYTIGGSGNSISITNNAKGTAGVAISNADPNAFNSGFVNGTGTAGTTSGTVNLTDFSITDSSGNAVSLKGTYASADDLAAEINKSVAGVYASTDNGKLKLTSSSDLTLGGTDATTMGFASTSVKANTDSLSTANVKTTDAALSTVQKVDSALSSVSSLRSQFGAIQNRFDSVISNLSSSSENLTASRSRIQDTDFAAETASLTRGQILQQAGTAMLAQANSLPNGVLSLLR